MLPRVTFSVAPNHMGTPLEKFISLGGVDCTLSKTWMEGGLTGPRRSLYIPKHNCSARDAKAHGLIPGGLELPTQKL